MSITDNGDTASAKRDQSTRLGTSHYSTEQEVLILPTGETKDLDPSSCCLPTDEDTASVKRDRFTMIGAAVATKGEINSPSLPLLTP